MEIIPESNKRKQPHTGLYLVIFKEIIFKGQKKNDKNEVLHKVKLNHIYKSVNQSITANGVN